MKTKSLRKKILIRNIISLVLCLLMLFTAILLAGATGCEDGDLDDFEGETGGGGSGSGTGSETTEYGKLIDGFKVVYANMAGQDTSEDIADQTRYLIGTCIPQFLSYYGYGFTGPGDNKCFPDSIRMLVVCENENVTIQYKTDNIQHWNWKWTINPNILTQISTNMSNELYSDLDTWRSDAIGYFTDLDNNPLYNFSTLYSSALNIVLYEIMLGYDNLTTFKVEFNELNSRLSIKNCPQGISLNGKIVYDSIREVTDEEVSDYSKDLKDEYTSNTRYIGFTKKDADKLINYILDEVIGNDLVYFDYFNYRGNDINYRDYVRTIANLIYSLTYDGSGDLWEFEYQYSQGEQKTPVSGVTTKFQYATNPEQIPNKGGYAATAATFLKYFEGETFFGDPDAEFQFNGVPCAEYQSVLVVPASSLDTIEDGGLKLESGFCFNFLSYNHDLQVKTKVRYYVYDEETSTGTLYEFECDTINFTDGENQLVDGTGKICYENDFYIDLDTAELDDSLVEVENGDYGESEYYTIPFFPQNDNKRGSTINESSNNLSHVDNSDYADYYKVIESENAFGALTITDERKMQCTFFEIVFDVIKSPEDPENTDYNFAMVISSGLFTPGIW